MASYQDRNAGKYQWIKKGKREIYWETRDRVGPSNAGASADKDEPGGAKRDTGDEEEGW